jgi:hypothetical protein
VNTLPLNGRDYDQLARLGGGAVDFGSTGRTASSIGSIAERQNLAR